MARMHISKEQTKNILTFGGQFESTYEKYGGIFMSIE
jgi:hypothetical protein